MLWNIDHLKVFLRDRDLNITAQIPWIEIQVELKTRRASTWAIKCNSYDRVLNNLHKGGGILITLGEYTVIEGFMDVLGPRSWDFDQGSNHISFSGREDLSVIADEIAWPFPTTATGTIIRSEDQRKYEGPAETVILNLISENVGTTRDANRNIDTEPTDPWLVEVPTTDGRGPVTSVYARYEPIMDLVRLALENTDLDLTCRPNEDRDGIEMEVIEYRDMTDNLTFSSLFQNVKNVEYQESIPQFNSMILGLESHDLTEDDDTIRRRRVRGRHFQTHGAFPNTQQEWRKRIAHYDDAGDLRDDPETQNGTEAPVIAAVDEYAISRFIQATSDTWVRATLISTARAQLYRNFELGDLVVIEPEPGIQFEERISSITINASTESGRLDIIPVVGVPGEDMTDSIRDKLQRETFDLVRRITGR